MHDNHEIDFELLNSDRSALFTSVYTDYQYVNDLCLFHRNSARIDIATGEVFATVPGNEGNWDLVQVESLPFTVPGFDHSASFYTMGLNGVNQRYLSILIWKMEWVIVHCLKYCLMVAEE